MSAKIKPELMYRLNCSGRMVGLFTKKQLLEMRIAIDITLAQSHISYAQEMIVQTVCSVFGLERQELFRNRRMARIAWPRQIAMALMYEFTGLSTTEVGEFFGGKDHGTVLHALKVVQVRRPLRTEGAEIRNIEALLSAAREQKPIQSISASSGDNSADANGHSRELDCSRSATMAT